MKRYLISTVVVLVVLALAWIAFGQQQSERTQRFAQYRQARQKALEVLEKQIAKLKEGMELPAFDRSRFQEMSEEERAKFGQERMKAREAQQTVINTIIAQVAILQGQMQPPAEGERFILVNTADLKAIQKLAVKEKARETSDRITRLLEPPRRGSRGRGRQQGEAEAKKRQGQQP